MLMCVDVKIDNVGKTRFLKCDGLTSESINQ